MAVDGTYNTEMSTPMGKQTGTCILKSEGSTLTGTYKTARGDQNFTGTVEGDACKWQMNIPSPMGGQLTLTFNVKVTAAGMEGTVQLGQFGNAPLKGTKVA